MLVLVGCLALLASGASLGGNVDSARPLAANDQPLATANDDIFVSNTNPNPVQTRTVLKADHRYRIVVSGTVSDWCPKTAKKKEDCSFGSPLAIGKGVDALYCYAKFRCPQRLLWRQLRVNNMGLDEFAGKAGKIPYRASHAYTVLVSGISGKLTLGAYDALAGSTSDNSGAFHFSLTDVGSAKTTTQPATSNKQLRKQQLQRDKKYAERASVAFNYLAATSAVVVGILTLPEAPVIGGFAIVSGVAWGIATYYTSRANQDAEELEKIQGPNQRSTPGPDAKPDRRGAAPDPRVRAAEQALSKDANRALTLARTLVKGKLSASTRADTLRELASLLRRQAGLRTSLRKALAASQPELGRKFSKEQLDTLRATIASGALARSIVSKTRNLGLQPPSADDVQQALEAQLPKLSGKSFLQLLTDPALARGERQAASALTSLAKLGANAPA